MLARWLCSSSASTNRLPGLDPALDARRPRPRRRPWAGTAAASSYHGLDGQARRSATVSTSSRASSHSARACAFCDVPLHAQRQRLDALEQQEGVERGDRRADVAQQLHPQLDQRYAPAGRAPRPRSSGRGSWGPASVKSGEALGVRAAVEVAAVDDDAADRGAVPAEELGRRVHDDVGAVLERAAAGTASARCCRRSAARRPRARRRRRPRRRARCRAGCRSSRRRTALVFGRIAARHASRSSGSSTNVDLDAELRAACSGTGCTCRRRARRWRRCGRRPRRCSGCASVSAACPEAKATAPTPPSSAAMRCSSDVLGRVHDPRVDVAELGRARTGPRRARCRGRRRRWSGRSAWRGRRWSGRRWLRRGSAWSRRTRRRSGRTRCTPEVVATIREVGGSSQRSARQTALVTRIWSMCRRATRQITQRP